MIIIIMMMMLMMMIIMMMMMIIIIIIMEICKRPTYKNILTAQGAYTSRNADNILQHKIKI